MSYLQALPEKSGAYRWWYLDAISDDGNDVLVVIFFCGSVFSPYYAGRIRSQQQPSPHEHSAVHVVHYHRGKQTMWLLAEHSGISIAQTRQGVQIGRSQWKEHQGRYIIDIDDTGPGRIVGSLMIDPLTDPLTQNPVSLDRTGTHRWHAVVPRARVTAKFTLPELKFSGTGYHDTNDGDGPMENNFTGWDWQRIHRGGKTSVWYDVRCRNGERFSHSVLEGQGVQTTEARTTRERNGRYSTWGILIPESAGTIIDNSPFYTRYMVQAPDKTVGVGETLDLDRFSQGIVRWMLRWKTYRRPSVEQRIVPRL